MWYTISKIFQGHTPLNKLETKRDYYNVKIKLVEKVLAFIVWAGPLASVLKSMGVEVNDSEVARAVPNELP